MSVVEEVLALKREKFLFRVCRGKKNKKRWLYSSVTSRPKDFQKLPSWAVCSRLLDEDLTKSESLVGRLFISISHTQKCRKHNTRLSISMHILISVFVSVDGETLFPTTPLSRLTLWFMATIKHRSAQLNMDAIKLTTYLCPDTRCSLLGNWTLDYTDFTVGRAC